MGTADKPILVGAIVAVLLVIGAVSAPLAPRRPLVADLMTVLMAGLGWAAASGTGAALVPAVVGAGAAVLTRRTSLAILSGDAAGRTSTGPPPPREATVADASTMTTDIPATRPSFAPSLSGSTKPVKRPALTLGPTSSRRRFFAAGAIGAGSTAAALGAAAALRRFGPTSTPAPLPIPTEAAGPLTRGLVVEGLSPLITPTAAFYRIDEALIVPAVDTATWRLQVGGMVGAPFELSYADLLSAPLVERDITLCCVSNDVGGKLVGTARWTGVRLADLLRRAGVDPAATQVVGRSVDGFSVGFPVVAALDGREALVAVGMNGEPLLPRHGFPARLVVPGLYGFVSATKWLREIELTTWDAFDPYWVVRGWAREAPIKVSSRVDVPRDYTRVAPGRQVIAGVAWAPGSGISAVSVRIDGGEWQPTRLGPSLGEDAWRQWTTEWEPTPGTHTVEVRAVTIAGLVQTEEKKGSFPNGSSGLHTSHVRVVPVE